MSLLARPPPPLANMVPVLISKTYPSIFYFDDEPIKKLILLPSELFKKFFEEFTFKVEVLSR